MIFCPFLSAEEKLKDSASPLSKIKQMLEEPSPDILKEKLSQAEQAIEKTKNDATEDAENDMNTNGPDNLFKNPFIPQIPQEAKTAPVPSDNSTPVVVPVVAVTPQFTVAGVVWNSKKPQAILNGQVVGVGDHVSNWAVSEITKEGVRVTSEEQNLWIKPLVNPGTKRP